MMPDWLSSILEWLANRNPILVYFFLFGNALFESIFPPYPSDGIVLIVSFLAGQGAYNPYLVYLLTVMGSFAGVMIIYRVGRHKGRGLILFTRIFTGRHIEQSEKIFKKYGDAIVLLNRFLPGLRAPICFVAGLSKIGSFKMAVFSFMSIAVWNAILVPIGFTVGSNWERASSFLKNYNIAAWSVILIPLFLALIFYLVRKFVIAK